MTRIGDFLNRAGFQPTTSSGPTAQSAPALKHPVLAQIFSALEQRCSPATRSLIDTKLAQLPPPIRQALTNTLRKLVDEIHQHSQADIHGGLPSKPLHTPSQLHQRREISIEEILRNNGYPMPHYASPPAGSRQSSAHFPDAARTTSDSTGASSNTGDVPGGAAPQRAQHTAPASAARHQKPRLSMQDRPGASHIQQLRANGMSDSDLMALKDDIRAITESGGSATRQEEFDKKYGHIFDSPNEGGIRDNAKNYAVLWMLITKEVRKQT